MRDLERIDSGCVINTHKRVGSENLTRVRFIRERVLTVGVRQAVLECEDRGACLTLNTFVNFQIVSTSIYRLSTSSPLAGSAGAAGSVPEFLNLGNTRKHCETNFSLVGGQKSPPTLDQRP